MHALCGVIMGFLIQQTIFEKKHNYLNLILALLIPVGMHGLYNYSYASPLISNQIANVILFVFFLRAIIMFKSLKSKQLEGIISHKKYFIINKNIFVQASSTVLLFYLILNYIVNIIL